MPLDDIKSKLAGFTGGDILASIKKIYFGLEDRYYGVLDQINKKVPIYKIIDPIDKVFPSFLLLILFVFFVILFIALFPIFTFPAEFNTTIKVTDTSGKVLEGALIEIDSELFQETFSDTTDAWGEVQLKIPADELSVDAKVSLKSFDTFDDEVLLISDEIRTVKLKLEQIDLGPSVSQKTILLINARTNVKIDSSATIEFSCSTGDAAPPTQTRSDATFTVTPSSNCGQITATVRANGFEPRSKFLTQSTTRLELAPVESTGKIHVTVKNFDGSNAPDALLSLFDETTNAEVDSGTTATSGTYQFDEIEPGSYKVGASPIEGAPAIKTGIDVSAGDTEYVTINLPEVLQGKNLFVKVVDLNGNDPIVNATLLFYAGSDRVDSKTTGTDGTARQLISDETLTYKAVITHPNYLTSIAVDIPVKDASDSSPYLIKITKKITVPPVNHPVIFVRVVDEEQQPVEDASVWIYDNDFPELPLNHPAKKSNVDGNVVFDSLAPGTYFAKALANEKDGQSEAVFADAAEFVFLTLTLVLGEGDIEVTVFDAESAEEAPIENASVEFFGISPPNVKGQLIDSCTTDTAGKCTSNLIGADKIVYARATAPEFVPIVSDKEISIVDGSTEHIELGLIPTTSIPLDKKIISEFVQLCDDWDCDSSPNKLESNDIEEGAKTYYARFNLILPVDDQNTYLDIKQHIRVGSNEMTAIPVNDYKIKLKEVRAAAANAIILSDCWDETNNFYNSSDCSTLLDAKMANVEWAEMQYGIIPVTIKFVIEPGLEDETEIPIYYQAKANLGSGEYSTLEKVKLFKIGQVLCEGQDVAWGFELTNTADGNTFSVEASEEAYPLLLSTEYDLGYWIYNCSNFDVQANLSVSNQNPSNAISFPELSGQQPFAVLTEPFPKSTIISSNEETIGPLQMLTMLETGGSLTDVVLTLVTTPTLQNGIEQTIYFSISADNAINVQSLPERLSDIAANPDLFGIVVDAETGNPLEGAVLKLIVPSPAEQIVTAGRTSADGFFSFGNTIQGPLLGVSEVVLEIRKAGYKTFSVPIPVGGLTVVWSPDFACIDIDNNALAVRRDLGNSDSFNVETNDCNRMVEVILESELVMRIGGDIVDSEDVVVLNTDDFQEINVAAEVPIMADYPLAIGEYYVSIRARFDGDDDGVFTLADGPYSAPFRKARVFVTDPDSCFRLADPDLPGDDSKMKSSFNLKQGSDDGLIVNDCFVYVEDTSLPALDTTRMHGINPEAITLNQPLLRKTNPEAHNMVEVLEYKLSGNYEQSISPNQGFVELQWIDFYMTDEEHNSGDRHRVWAQLNRDGCTASPAGSIIGDCFNITGQYPLTRSRLGCLTQRQDPSRCSVADPVISNSNDPNEDGWVDTDTAHPANAKYKTQVSKAPIWQGRHNICNNEIECSIDRFRSSETLPPYFIGLEADKFILEIEGENTWLTQVNWVYKNYDEDHDGKIEFEVINNNVSGESYALLKATDSVGSGENPGQENSPFNWFVVATAVQESTTADVMISSDTTIAIEKMIGISADPDSGTRTATYDFDPTTDLSDSDSFNASFQDVATDLANTPVSVNSFTLDLSTVCTPDQGPPEECLRSFFIFFYLADSWHFGEKGDGANIDQNGLFTLDFVADLGQAQEVLAYVLINDGEASDNITVESFSQELYFYEEFEDIGSDNGEDIIPAEQNEKTGITFDIPLVVPGFSTDSSVVYNVSSTTPGINIYFEELGAPIQTSNSDATITAKITTRVTERTLEEEYFHVRLEGETQTECLAYNGVSGVTGANNKPRVRFNWEWDRIDKETCSEENLDYIYCDATQFTISLLYRLEEIREVASQGFSTENLARIQKLKLFNAYLMEDSITDDFRADLNWFLLREASPDPEESLLSLDHPWQNYLTDIDRLVFNPETLEPGLYDVFITFNFDGEDYIFYGTGGGDDLLGNITVNFTKIADPLIASPFYSMPIDGTIGRRPDGSYDRQGYGVSFSNPGGIITIVGSPGDAIYVSTESDSGKREIQTAFIEDFSTVNLGGENYGRKGELFSIAKTGDVMTFSPSIATPVLLEMNSADSEAQAFYYILDRDQGTPISSSAGFMNIWSGAGSTMGDPPSNCTAFNGLDLSYRQQDVSVVGLDGICELKKPTSYGFKYPGAPNAQQMFIEAVFFVPKSMSVALTDSCTTSTAKFYSPAQTVAQSQIGLSNMDGFVVSSIQDVVDLIGEGQICVSEDSTNIRFWWNPQSLLKELDGVKNAIPKWSEKECMVAQIT